MKILLIVYLCTRKFDIYIVKIVLAILGSISFGLAVAGIFLPLLPTTPLLLLAAALWLRSSARLHDWLINHRIFGEYIRNFKVHRAIPLRVKIYATTLVWLTIGYCIFVVVNEYWWAQVLMALLATAITWHILSYKTLKK